MGPTAFGTSDATDAKTEGAFRKLYASEIVTMDGHTGRMTTGTGYLMKLNTINDRIIKGLRNMVAILGKNGYHSIVNGHGFIHACGEWRTGLLQGAGPLFFSYETYDNTKGTA